MSTLLDIAVLGACVYVDKKPKTDLGGKGYTVYIEGDFWRENLPIDTSYQSVTHLCKYHKTHESARTGTTGCSAPLLFFQNALSVVWDRIYLAYFLDILSPLPSTTDTSFGN